MQDIYNYIPETNHVSRVCSVTICATCNFISPVKYVLYFYISTFRSMCAVSSMVAFVAPWSCTFLVHCSGIVRMIIKWFQSPLLLLVSLLLSHPTRAKFLLWGPYMLKYSQLLSCVLLFLLLLLLMLLLYLSFITCYTFSSARVTMVNLIGKPRSFLTHAGIITAHIIWFTYKFMTDRDISVPRRFLWGGGKLIQRLYKIYVWFYKLCYKNHVRISELTSS